MKKVVSQDKEKSIITATQSFQSLMQATADALDAREEGIQAGIIISSMPTEEVIPYLYSLYVFIGYERKHSPITACNLLKIYCPEDFSITFEFYYRELAKLEGMDVNIIDFNDDSIIPFIHIPSFAETSARLGNKRHWNPFKEPFRSQWDFCYFADACLVEDAFTDAFIAASKAFTADLGD